MMFESKKPDGFTTESPIRAFTSFDIQGGVAIGKGFRPSLHHLARYLDAMEAKEGWTFVQVLLPHGEATDPTILFKRELVEVTIQSYPSHDHPVRSKEARYPLHTEDKWQDDPELDELVRNVALGVAIKDDPINPKHYGGTACAEIGELLTGNSYQVLKYNWRFGKKDDTEVERRKSLWYLDREIALFSCYAYTAKLPMDSLPDRDWFKRRLEGQDAHVTRTAWALIEWNRSGNIACLEVLRKDLDQPELGRGLEP